MSNAGDRRARRRGSALSEARDAHQEYKETGDREALARRNRAAREGTTSEEFRHFSEGLAGEMITSREDRKRRVRERGWRRR